MNKKLILIVDDEPINISVLANLFKPFFIVRACRSGEEALRAININPKPDLVLLDIMMTGIDGYTTLARIRDDPENLNIPVIFVSSLDSCMDEEKGFKLGAVDYITKPFKPAIVMARVNTHLQLKEAQDRLKNQNQWLEEEVIRRMHESQLIQSASLISLTQLIDTRDKTTGNHIKRTCKYIEILARGLQKVTRYENKLNNETILSIVKAAPLHDIGKIGIPDSILQKQGKLSEEEFRIIQTHCQIGGDALRRAINESLYISSRQAGDFKSSSLLFLEEAERIARYHHEKWDGSGYPVGLKGIEIPISARLMAFADVYDALTSKRPYKYAWSIYEASNYMIKQKGLHFDPDIVDVFIAEQNSFENVLQLIFDN